MKNLKKVLALVLAFACAFTMFAGAAFTDQADIKVDSDVVDTLVSLGVIEGFEDGSFQPNGTVTRAQMAKMIYVLRTGNSDASAYNDDKTSFTDIGTHWARGYIKYCQSLNIIAGKSTTKFDPNGNVTAQEAAKMLLVTLGYDAQKAGLVGAGWASKTNALADENGLLENVNTSFTAACPRQYAAQLIYNAIDAATVVWRDDAYTNQNYNGKDNQTIGEKYMGLSKTVGILEEVTKDNDKDTYSLYVNTDKYEDECSGKKLLNNFTKVSKDYSALKYQKVKVLYKDKDKVFGVYAMTDDNTVVSAVMDQVKMDSADKIKIDGTKYTVDTNNSTVYVNGKDTNTKIAVWVNAHSEGENIGKASTVQAISNSSNNKINILKVTTFETKKVTYVGKDYVNAGKKYEEDAANFSSDLKKDDYVAISAKENYADDKVLLTKLETVEGKVTGIKGNDQVLIDGTWYTADYKANTNKVIDSWPSNGATVKLVLLNGFVQLVDTVTVGSSDFALVIETGSSSGLGSSKVADVLFADGTRKTVELDNDSEYKGTKKNGDTTYVEESAPKLATYEVSKGKYTFKAVSEKALNGYDEYATGGNLTIDGKVKSATLKKANTTANVFMKDTGVVFVQYMKNGDYEYKVVTGKDAANWKETTISLQALVKKDSGVNYAEMAVVTMTNNIPGGSNSTYAFALDDSYEKTIDGTKYTFVEAWNGSEAITMKSEDKVSIAAREAFEYSVNADGTYDLTKLAGKDTATQKYAVTQITSYDKTSGELTFVSVPVSKEYKITKDTVVLYVDSDAKKGAGEFDIETAIDTNNDGKIDANDKANVIYYSESGDDYIRLIVVDTNNEMKQ
ncbi:S-layer homology domain-containing protein [Agathobaculum butyriciproducens]|uniref:S-layer homology domain-containing protein n=1 Tax=Agathobaculum butyriciproducens TaxID=1628085 RepID=UPI003A8E3CE9